MVRHFKGMRSIESAQYIVTIILTHLTCKVYINDPVPEGNWVSQVTPLQPSSHRKLMVTVPRRGSCGHFLSDLT